ncbi:hypothetical protein PUN28_006306 [Cardiocondyla obscurior]|uniref:Peptidase S1 domain-containing protein n=1 Tax=Cardiocondyla obscurior TaxID=286306 RepID=A0AAW2GA15_9HYME
MFSITGVIIIYLTYCNAHDLPNTQISGGTDAADGRYPYQVSLKHVGRNDHFCSGTILSKRYVITAANCLESLHNATDVFVDAGSNNLYSSTRVTYSAEALIIHPNYNSTLGINDIGLIRLTKDITFNKIIKSINLIPFDQTFDKELDFIVTGWGKFSMNGQMSDRLREIHVKEFSQELCHQLYKNITNNHICSRQAIGKGICDGDIGSALTYDNELIGIASFNAIPCGNGYPDVFTRVLPYKPWINSYINAGSNQRLNIFFVLFVIYLCIYSFL